MASNRSGEASTPQPPTDAARAGGPSEGDAQSAASGTSAFASPGPGGTAHAAVRRAGERFTDWSFGELPELLELQGFGARGQETLVGYPALIDRGDAIELQVFDEPETASREHRAGLRRLFALALREPLRFFERNIPELQRLSMLYAAFGGTEDLKRDLVAAVLDRACLTDPLPTDRAAFEARVADARPRVTLIGNELARTLMTLLTEHAGLQKKLLSAKGFAQAAADISQQLTALLPARFVVSTAPAQFGHLARYLKAASARLDKLRTDPERDAQRMAEISPMLQNLARAKAALKGRHDPRLEDFRWMLEELRVSLFAQELRTPMPVSVKRLQKVWESMR
jgi:ATP-dependent helicase HrpA